MFLEELPEPKRSCGNCKFHCCSGLRCRSTDCGWRESIESYRPRAEMRIAELEADAGAMRCLRADIRSTVEGFAELEKREPFAHALHRLIGNLRNQVEAQEKRIAELEAERGSLRLRVSSADATLDTILPDRSVEDSLSSRIAFVVSMFNGLHDDLHKSNVRVAELETKLVRLRRAVESVQPDEADLDWLSRSIQRESPDVEVWWRQHASEVGFREMAAAIIGVWEAGRLKTARVQEALKGGT